ncbi:hypothetical protein FFLO_03966 [Filobasidium floriforme]|uniref:Uncharacterized protein n=1 Tax=Filobasidium floriforme TaxID=5210 RepID=A0A8K0JL78_9TREE|nr:hypothetical protein FFLO_03966 [Filobasidium floriforme]
MGGEKSDPEDKDSLPLQRPSGLRRLLSLHRAWLSECWNSGQWDETHQKIYAQGLAWKLSGPKKAVAFSSWMVLSIFVGSLISDKLPFVTITTSDGTVITVSAGNTCFDGKQASAHCIITPPWQEMSSATMQGQEFPTSGKYLGIVISAHLAVWAIIGVLVFMRVLFRSPYWTMNNEQRVAKKLKYIRDPVVPSLVAMLITGALAVIDITYVKIIDGVTLKYAQAVPYAAIGMAIWFSRQWYIVRTQDKLWLAREYHIARRKGKA